MTYMNLQEWIKSPELLDRETLYELRNVLARFPYFQAARLLYLKNLFVLHDISFGQELRKAALYIADRRMLFNAIEGEKFIIKPLPGEMNAVREDNPGLDRTLSLIETFLSTIPENSSSSPKFDISTDYTAYLLEHNESSDDLLDSPKMNGQELIDGFIEKAGNNLTMRVEPQSTETVNIEYPQAVEEEIPDDESCFTETLAKIYIKQKRYSKALEIIKKLSLKYPKKNAYFADQIRFLEKLIINTKSK